MAKKKSKKRTLKKGKKQTKWGFWFVSLFVIGLVGFIYFWYSSEQMVQTSSHFHEIVPKGYKSTGIDVSHHQGEIDWEELFVNKHFDTILDFVYCKATEGTDFLDKQYARNREYLNMYGILNGAYHYFNPKAFPKPQAEHFLSVYKPRSIDLPPVVDIEEEGFSDEDLRTKLVVFCEEVKRKTGVQPVIYTSLNFYETKFRGKLTGYKFWIAAYSREPEYMLENDVIHWQFSDGGRLPGISEKVDLNVSKLEF